ncbi:hypothetical protein SAMN06265222_104162 [Neorhodopirellula lusitana]|uniref:Uncharacterized protein n=1 Tax=Neorhodopirellula lusitana TaxID=445327 RepID=A0ABY1PZF9_9BACT|nr:hypothetical protein [Neorhodopirellula lusitana]SMP53847.1 hypothetical protein SAMN06265222_104162 [Neorhodopirellula lusitana]
MAVKLIRKPTILIFMMLATVTTTVSADFGTWMHRQKMAYYRNQAWPDPFNEADAVQVVQPFEIMKNNGWRTHNTIGHALFRAGDGALLASGQNRVRWIATQSPTARREIYVLQGRTQEETKARMASVREAVAHYVGDGVEPTILVTTTEPSTTPGAIATKINRDRIEQMALPKLPTTTASGQQGVTQ